MLLRWTLGMDVLLTVHSINPSVGMCSGVSGVVVSVITGTDGVVDGVWNMHLAHCRCGKGPILACGGRLRRHGKRREPNHARFRTVDTSARLKLPKMSMFAPIALLLPSRHDVQ